MGDFNLDTDLLGLQYELIDHLSEKEFYWFEHFSGVEVDMSNRELKIDLICDWNRLEKIVNKWAAANKFKTVSYVSDRNCVYIKRGKD